MLNLHVQWCPAVVWQQPRKIQKHHTHPVVLLLPNLISATHISQDTECQVPRLNAYNLNQVDLMKLHNMQAVVSLSAGPPHAISLLCISYSCAASLYYSLSMVRDGERVRRIVH